MRAAILLLAALPLCCSAAFPFRIDVMKPKFSNACEALSATECEARSDQCSLCQNQFLPDVKVCLEHEIAEVIPPFIFECSGIPEPEPPVIRTVTVDKKPQPTPWDVCESYGPAQCKKNDDRCSLCTDKASGVDLCFRPSVAAKLPPFIFKCSDVKAAQVGGRRSGPLSAEPEDKPQPAPWEVCESYGPAQCKKNDDRCSLCTEKASGVDLCFRPSVAAKLPPFVFDCSGVKGEVAADGAAAAGKKPKPEPWTACEAFNATECKAHSTECALCTVEGKKKGAKPMCFGLEIAKKLPPFIFHCKLPKGDAGKDAAPVDAEAGAVEEGTEAQQAVDLGTKPKWLPCESFNETECAAHRAVCARCTVEGKEGKPAKPMCFSPTVAKFLPASIFHCKLPKPEAGPTLLLRGAAAAEPALVAELVAELAGEQGSNKPQPAPWDVCESYGPTQCKKNDDRCSLCTEKASGVDLCFRPSVAAKLPPFVFECKVKRGAAVQGAASSQEEEGEEEEEGARGAQPWVPCEAFAAAECAVHKECAPCFVEGDEAGPKPLCFGVDIAQALPPHVFHCKLPKEALPGNQA